MMGTENYDHFFVHCNFDLMFFSSGLLRDFRAQKDELAQLETETASLEAELNDLLLKFEKEKSKFSACNRP